jgi:structural maintenance of chromosomes protein 5
MDPKNERKIFQMLVDITCKPGQSQYFFVTPKLLTDLPHSDLMTISVVHNGKNIDDPYVFLDVEEEEVHMADNDNDDE